jgi:chlorite dismutase
MGEWRQLHTPALGLDEGEWLVSRPGRFTPEKITVVRIGYEVRWAPESVWTLRKTKFCPVGNRTPVIQPVA